MNTEVLRDLGFTDREIKVYIALLEIGTSTAGPIASHSGLPASKVYETLDKLIQKGLANYIVVSKTKHFSASAPKEILEIIEERKRSLFTLLKELEQKQAYAREPQIAVVHDGFKAVKALFNRIAYELRRGDTYRAFAFREAYQGGSAPSFLRGFHQHLAQKKVIDKIFGSIRFRKEILATYEGNKNVRIKFIKRATPVGVIMYHNKVVQAVWGERPTAIEITSRQINDHYARFFDEMWKESK